MALRLDLKLEDMKRVVGWDDNAFRDIVSRVPLLDSAQPRPFKLTYTVRIDDIQDAIHAATSLGRSYYFFLRRIGIPQPDYTPHFSEPLSNLVYYGGDAIKEAGTLIENYIPDIKNGSLEFIVRITNPNAKEWDYEKVIAEMPEVDENGRRHWLTTVNWKEYPWISYDNHGKDFLALHKVP